MGSAFAAELGTMAVTEQTDSLRMLGSDPVDYLVSPRVLACMIATPILTLMCFVMGAAPCSPCTASWSCTGADWEAGVQLRGPATNSCRCQPVLPCLVLAHLHMRLCSLRGVWDDRLRWTSTTASMGGTSTNQIPACAGLPDLTCFFMGC